MATKFSALNWCLAIAIFLFVSAAGAEPGGETNWTQVATLSNKLDDGTVMTSTLYVELPIMRSADRSLSVVHSRISFSPAMTALRPGDETKTIEFVQAFDCQTHEYWSVYTIGLPFPGFRNTVRGSGERRQIAVNNYDSDAVRETDWAGAALATYACKH